MPKLENKKVRFWHKFSKKNTVKYSKGGKKIKVRLVMQKLSDILWGTDNVIEEINNNEKEEIETMKANCLIMCCFSSCSSIKHMPSLNGMAKCY